MALAITSDGDQTITDATTSMGVAYLSGDSGGASVSLIVLMSNSEVVKLTGSKLIKGANVVTHGTGATLRARTVGATGYTDLTLDFHTL